MGTHLNGSSLLTLPEVGIPIKQVPGLLQNLLIAYSEPWFQAPSVAQGFRVQGLGFWVFTGFALTNLSEVTITRRPLLIEISSLPGFRIGLKGYFTGAPRWLLQELFLKFQGCNHAGSFSQGLQCRVWARAHD